MKEHCCVHKPEVEELLEEMETWERDLRPPSSLEGGMTELVLGLEGASSSSSLSSPSPSSSSSQTGVEGMEGRLSMVVRKSTRYRRNWKHIR